MNRDVASKTGTIGTSYARTNSPTKVDNVTIGGIKLYRNPDYVDPSILESDLSLNPNRLSPKWLLED